MARRRPDSTRGDRAHARSKGARGFLVAIAVALPLTVALALSDGGRDAEAGAAPSPAGAATRDVLPMRAPSEGEGAPTARARLDALRHPLLGISRASLVSRLGPPTRRATEGGPGMELLEYDVADEQYQVVLVQRRVVEITRFG